MNRNFLFFLAAIALSNANAYANDPCSFIAGSLTSQSEICPESTPDCLEEAGGFNISDALVKKNSFFISGSFLYWQSEVSGVPSGAAWNFSDSNSFIFQSLEYDFHWEPGWQVAMGYCFNRNDYPVLQLNWTHIHGLGVNSSASSQQDLTKVIPDLNAISDPVVSYRYTWKLYYDLLDLDFKQNLFNTAYFNVVPLIGVRGAKINQRLRLPTVAFINNSFSSDFTPTGITADSSAHCYFSGVGPRFGSAIRCYLSRNWDIIGRVSASFLRGRFNVDQKFNLSTNPNLPNHLSIPNKIWRNQIGWDGGLGIEWRYGFSCKRRFIAFSALYEMSYWPRMFRLSELLFAGVSNGPPSVSLPRDEDVSLQGLTASISMFF